MEPLVSIIVPAYNAELYIEQGLKSICSQTYNNIEIIVVNDGSDDNTSIIVEQFINSDSRVCLINQKNAGPSAARNKGIECSKGKYICFFDADDWVADNTIADNVKLLVDKSADLAIFGFWYCNVDTGNTRENPPPKAFSGNDVAFFDELFTDCFEKELLNSPWNKMYKAEIIKNNSIRFDERFSIYEDISFNLAYLFYANKIVVNDKMYYKYMWKSKGSLITTFREYLIYAIEQIYINGINYCNKYEVREEQEKTIATLFVKLAIMYTKQICLNSKLSSSRKKELLNEVCENGSIIEASKIAKLNSKKKIIKFFIIRKCTWALRIIYRFQSLLKE